VRKRNVRRKIRVAVRKVIRELCPSVRSCLQTTTAIVTLVIQSKGLVGLNGGGIEDKLRDIFKQYGVPFNVVRTAFYLGCEIYEREIIQ